MTQDNRRSPAAFVREETHAFLIALQFLTRLPVTFEHPPDAGARGKSLPWYPAVGLLLGLLLTALGWLGSGMATGLHAALLLTAWVVMTGVLHLDGLADTADAWVGGFGDRERTLTIMKDPRSGPAAVTILVLVLLLKFSALIQLLHEGLWTLLVLPPLLGRTAALLLFLTTPYIRPSGLGSALSKHLPQRAGILSVATATATTLLLGQLSGLWILITATILFLSFRGLLLSRLGGTTGDTAGALIELTETVILITLAIAT